MLKQGSKDSVAKYSDVNAMTSQSDISYRVIGKKLTTRQFKVPEH